MAYEELFIEKVSSPPLSKQDFLMYFNRYKKGDLEARNIIIEHNIGLVCKYVSSKFHDIPYKKKDLVSAGILGLIEALDIYDITKGTSFTTIAYPRIAWAISHFIRNNDKHCMVESFQQEVSHKEGNYTLEDVLVSGESLEEQYEEKELHQKLYQLLNNLSDEEKELIGMYFYQQLTQQAIANKLGTSQIMISRKLKHILQKLRNEFQSMGILEKQEFKKQVRTRK